MAPLHSPNILYSRSTALSPYTRIHVLPFLGLGALLGFIFLAFILGTLESLRKNSPSEFARTKGRIKTQDTEITSQNVEIARQNAEIARQRARIEELEGNVVGNDAVLQQNRAEMEMKDDTIRRLEDVNANREIRIEEMNAHNEELTDAGAELRLERNALYRDLNAERQRTTHLEDANAESRQRLTHLTERIVEADMQRENLEGAVAESRLQRNTLEHDLNTVRRRAQELEGNETELTRRLNALSEELTEREEQEQKLNELLAGLRLQHKALNRDVAVERGRAEQLEESRTERRRGIRHMPGSFPEDQMNELIPNLQHENEALRRSLQEYGSRVEHLERRADELLDQIESLTARLLERPR